MELGLDFDDTDFVEKIKEKQTLSSYNAKICYQKWFLDDRADNGKNDPATLYKYRGDYYHHHEDYNTAIKCYIHSLESLGSHNRTMRRELTDSLARCYIKVKDYCTAKQYVDKVLSDCLTIDHWCQALLLKQQFLCCSGNYTEEVKVLHQLITNFYGNVHFWIKLGVAYRNILELKQCDNTSADSTSAEHSPKVHDSIKSKGTVVSDNDSIVHQNSSTQCQTVIQDINDECCKRIENHNVRVPANDCTMRTSHLNTCCISDVEYMELTSGYPLKLMLLTCLIRTRMILISVQFTVDSFVKHRNTKQVEKLSEQIKELCSDNAVIDKATQFLKVDMHEEESSDIDDKQGSQDAKALMENKITSEEFNQKWFSWIRREHIC